MKKTLRPRLTLIDVGSKLSKDSLNVSDRSAALLARSQGAEAKQCPNSMQTPGDDSKDAP